MGCNDGSTWATGVVTLDGKPLAKAAVQFFPRDGKGQPSGTTTDANGRYRVLVSPVRLKILVTKREIVGTKTDPLDPTTASSPIVKELLPEAYTATDTTPLVAEPAQGTTTTIDLPLVSSAR